MLLRLEATNYRSFRDRCELSLIADEGDRFPARTLLRHDERGRKSPFLAVPAVALYGPNAGGKTNVLKALDYMHDAVVLSHAAWAPGSGTQCAPFKFAAVPRPSSFVIDIVVEGVRHAYSFVTDGDVFLEEKLSFFPVGRERLLFSRTSSTDGDGKAITTVKAGDALSLDARGLRSLEKRTRGNSLFLSAAAQDDQPECLAVQKWFRTKLQIIADGDMIAHMGTAATTRFIQTEVEKTSKVIDLMRRAEPRLRSIEVREKDAGKLEFISSLIADGRREAMVNAFALNQEVLFGFSDDSGKEISLLLFEQSRGTQHLFGLASTLLLTLEKGYCLVLDELEASIHPHLARFVVDLFKNADTNPNGAQLIFSTHDTNLLDPTLLHRDQVWFVEKDDAGASHLYPLTDFDPVKGENIERGYLRGRFGAIPALGLPESWLS